jgi:MscS family membrane protein
LLKPPSLIIQIEQIEELTGLLVLEYSSTLEQIKNLTNAIKNHINDNSDFIVNDNYKAFVRLDKFNDSSIDILIYCFTSTNDWETFLEIKEKLAIEIKKVKLKN